MLNCLGVDEAVVGFVGLVEGGEAARVLGPGETSAVDDRAAKRGAVAAEKFRQRMNRDIGAVIERFQQDRRGDGIVDHQRHAMAMRDLCQRFDVADIARRIADGLGENRLGILVDQSFDGVGLVAFGETGGNALARQDMAEQGVRGAVELRHRDDVAAGVGKVNESKMQRRLAAGDRERADAAFELANALFQNRGGRVRNPAVAKAFRLEIEQSGAVIGAVEGVGRGLVDRNRDGLGRRIGFVAGVNCDRFAAHRPPLRSRRISTCVLFATSLLEADAQAFNN